MYKIAIKNKGTGVMIDKDRMNRPMHGATKYYTNHIRSSRRQPAHSRGRVCPAPLITKSEFQFLRNINIQDRSLKAAAVSNALRGMDMRGKWRSFERFNLYTLVFATIYLERLGEIATCFDTAKLYFACNIIALKYQDDYVILNYNWNRSSGMSIEELNMLEIYVLSKLMYKVEINYRDVVQMIKGKILKDLELPCFSAR